MQEFRRMIAHRHDSQFLNLTYYRQNNFEKEIDKNHKNELHFPMNIRSFKIRIIKIPQQSGQNDFTVTQ